MSAEDILAELLDKRNEEIAELHERIERLEREIRGTPGSWTRHVELPEEQKLPVPRLEIVWEKDGNTWASYRALYRLVYRHLLGDIIGVPLGETKISGGNWRAPKNDGIIDLPFRDGAHIAYDSRMLGLPAYVVLDNEYRKVEPRKDDPNS